MTFIECKHSCIQQNKIVANWWSCIGKGLRLQPAQEACFKLFEYYPWELQSFKIFSYLNYCYRFWRQLHNAIPVTYWQNSHFLARRLKNAMTITACQHGWKLKLKIEPATTAAHIYFKIIIPVIKNHQYLPASRGRGGRGAEGAGGREWGWGRERVAE